MYPRYRRTRGAADLFENYREIEATYPSSASCGHDVFKGDRIGWHPGLKKAKCAACWAAWVAENAEADALERSGM